MKHVFKYKKLIAGLKMNIDNLTEVDQNVEERFELSETESNRHQDEKLQTRDVFEVSFAFALKNSFFFYF